MRQWDGQTKVFKERYEGLLLDTAPDLTRFSTLLDETWMDQERERIERETVPLASTDADAADVDMTDGSERY